MAQGCEKAIPAELEIHTEPRPPERDPTLGIPVTVDRAGTPTHRLVTIGDSITQGFMSLAVFRTDLSWPAIVARELGAEATFSYPVYEDPDGPGGLPLDLERLARAIQTWAGPTLNWGDLPRTLARLRSYMDGIEDHWERDWEDRLPPPGPPFHNLAVYGWDLLDTLALDADRLQRRIDAGRAKDQLVRQVVENDNDRAGLVVAHRARDGDGRARSVLQAAAALGADGADGPGIETLVVALGANNALGSVVRLEVCWSTEDYLDGRVDQRLKKKGGFTVWRPSHFAAEWAEVVAAIERIDARHVIVATVPAVTIPPVSRGVGTKVRPESRYFPYYTPPVDHRRRVRPPPRSPPHGGRRPHHRLGHRRLQRQHHRLRPRRADQGPRLVPVRPRRPARQPGDAALRGPACRRGPPRLVGAVRAPPGAGRA